MKAIKFTTPTQPYQHQVKLDKTEYDLLKKAREVLERVKKNEELYDLTIESYVDVKTAMYEMSIRVISNGFNSGEVNDYNSRSKLNRLFFNTLNLSKLYLDKHFHAKSNTSFVQKITGELSLHEQIKEHREGILKLNKNYELGANLRNYCQHSSLPIQAITAGFNSSPNTGEKSTIFHVRLSKKELKKAKVTSASVLNKFKDEIDLHEVMDGYILALSEMHLKNRELTNKYVQESVRLINSAKSRIEQAHDNVEYGIEVIEGASENRLFGLHLEWFEITKHLQNKNAHTLNFRHFNHAPYGES